MVYNCDSHKMGDTEIPNDGLWCERWPLWVYVGVIGRCNLVMLLLPSYAVSIDGTLYRSINK